MIGRLDQTLRLLRTVRHLKAEQVAWQVGRRFSSREADLRPAPDERRRSSALIKPCPKASRALGGFRISTLATEFDVRAAGWDSPTLSDLVRFNIHYFDWLQSAIDVGAGSEFIRDWIARNHPAAGTAWHPYPTSLRIVNWLKAHWQSPILDPEALHSLAVQARWLNANVERHILGNHVIANGKALMFAAMAFRGSESEVLAKSAHRILAREIPEQVLADGGHFELSPMYHAIVLEDLLDIISMVRSFGDDVPAPVREVAAMCEARVPSMLRWLTLMSHPDGGPAFFNDCGIGVAPSLSDLNRYCRDLCIPETAMAAEQVLHLPDSGFVRLSLGRAVAFVDVGNVGASYIPGHAHADTLSLELSVGGARVLVNSGTSEYGAGPERSRQRGTAAHNAVTIDGCDSSEVWGGFRVGRRARVHGFAVSSSVGEVHVVASHDGYRYLAGAPCHRRAVCLTPDSLTIGDSVGVASRAKSHWHFAPGIRLSQSGTYLSLPGGVSMELKVDAFARGEISDTAWHLGFGNSRPNVSLSVPLLSGAGNFQLKWGLT